MGASEGRKLFFGRKTHIFENFGKISVGCMWSDMAKSSTFGVLDF